VTVVYGKVAGRKGESYHLQVWQRWGTGTGVRRSGVRERSGRGVVWLTARVSTLLPTRVETQ